MSLKETAALTDCKSEVIDELLLKEEKELFQIIGGVCVVIYSDIAFGTH
jgi:hypothetical protein